MLRLSLEVMPTLVGARVQFWRGTMSNFGKCLLSSQVPPFLFLTCSPKLDTWQAELSRCVPRTL